MKRKWLVRIGLYKRAIHLFKPYQTGLLQKALTLIALYIISSYLKVRMAFNWLLWLFLRGEHLKEGTLSSLATFMYCFHLPLW